MEMFWLWFVAATLAALSSARQNETVSSISPVSSAHVSKFLRVTSTKSTSTQSISNRISSASSLSTSIINTAKVDKDDVEIEDGEDDADEVEVDNEDKVEVDAEEEDNVEVDADGTVTVTKPIPTYVNHYVNVTWDEFRDAFVGSRFPAPNKTHYADFVHGVELYGNITSKREAAMFLSQLLHESGGLRYKAEIRCVENPKTCINEYKTPRLDVKGKLYFGRGYIQLTWAENYLAASKDLFGDDRLLKNPDCVASNEQYSWDVSFWYWKARVGVHPGIHRGEFGVSTMMINGGIECGGKPNIAAINRFHIYSNILAAFGIDEKPNPIGCKRRIGSSKYGWWALPRRRF